MAESNPIPNLEPRVAVLEQIATDTRSALERIERRLDAFEKRQHTDFLALLTIMLSGFVGMLGGFAGMLGAMAHGFHWI